MYDEIRPFVQSIWEVWLALLFIGIVVWALWPSRQKEMEHNARVIFEEDDRGE